MILLILFIFLYKAFSETVRKHMERSTPVKPNILYATSRFPMKKQIEPPILLSSFSNKQLFWILAMTSSRTSFKDSCMRIENQTATIGVELLNILNLE